MDYVYFNNALRVIIMKFLIVCANHANHLVLLVKNQLLIAQTAYNFIDI